MIRLTIGPGRTSPSAGDGQFDDVAGSLPRQMAA